MNCITCGNNTPTSPHDRLLERKRREAERIPYIDGQASEFYFHCENGNYERVAQIFEDRNQPPIDELVKREPNGNTALHIATAKGHLRIVRLLLDHDCNRVIRNRYGKLAVEEANTPEMRSQFVRSRTSDRFHESDVKSAMKVYLRNNNEKDSNSYELNTNNNDSDTSQNEQDETTENPLNFVAGFENEQDVQRYALNYQTTAMWLKFYNWFARTFPNFFQREYLQLEAFELHNNEDFKHFLKKKLGNDYEKILKKFDKNKVTAHQRAITDGDEMSFIERLILLYTNESTGFYRMLNRQLVDSTYEADNSPHLCDRFIIEFHIRADELEQRAITGRNVYRGATMNHSDLLVYERALSDESPGIIIFNAFTSTTQDKEVALNFIKDSTQQGNQVTVLFVIHIGVASPTVVGVSDVSEYPDEQEVLILPGNLFKVQQIIRDVSHTLKQDTIVLTEVHLEYKHMKVPLWKKFLHTIQSAKNSVTDSHDGNCQRQTK